MVFLMSWRLVISMDLPDDLTGILNPKALIDIAGTQSTD